jgi:peptide/nickel transport system substrate-binding protein
MRWRPLVLALSILSGLWAGETVRVATSEWNTLNPLLLSQDTDGEAVDLLFDRLISIDAQGNFIPEILESWKILDGGRQAILKIRPGLTWHDGSPIEAEDVVFTWKALRLPQVRRLADTAGGVTSMDSVTAEGPLIVRIQLKRPRGTLLSDIYSLIPVPRRHYQVGADPMNTPTRFHPIGSGPYRVVGNPTTKRLLLERWDGYRGIHPGSAPSIELWDDTEEKRILTAFQEERTHFASVGGLRYYLVRKGVQGNGLVRALTAPQAALDCLFMNCDPKLSLLGDLKVRQALAELIPWQEQARGNRFFPSRMATSFWPPESWAHDYTPVPLPSPARAAAILDAAGWEVGPDGWRRDAKGRVLELRIVGSGVDSPRSVVRLLAAQAAKVGMKIDCVNVPFPTLTAMAAKHEGDGWSMGWVLAMDPDVDAPLFTLEGYRTHANMSGYLNPEVDKLFDEGRHTLDPEARKRIYQRISAILYRDKPVAPISYTQVRVLVHRRLKGVSFNTLGQTYGFWPGRRGWRLDP